MHPHDYCDEMRSLLADRISALEEIIATMSIVKLLRLRRHLRASVKDFGWAGPTFADRRSQSIGDAWLARQQAKRFTP